MGMDEYDRMDPENYPADNRKYHGWGPDTPRNLRHSTGGNKSTVHLSDLDRIQADNQDTFGDDLSWVRDAEGQAQMVEATFLTCRICRVRVKRKNLAKHLRKVHGKQKPTALRQKPPDNEPIEPDTPSLSDDANLYRCTICGKYMLGSDRLAHTKTHPRRCSFHCIKLEAPEE